LSIDESFFACYSQIPEPEDSGFFMGIFKEFYPACGFEGIAASCPIAQNPSVPCEQFEICQDANTTPGEIIPTEFVERFPVEMTIDEVARLRAKHIKRDPKNTRPLLTIITSLDGLPPPLHDIFIRRALNGGYPLQPAATEPVEASPNIVPVDI